MAHFSRSQAMPTAESQWKRMKGQALRIGLHCELGHTPKTGNFHMAKYGKKAKRSVKRAMKKKKAGTLKSGKSGKKVTSRKQAIAIGLSEARKKGAKVPRKKKSSR